MGLLYIAEKTDNQKIKEYIDRIEKALNECGECKCRTY